MKNKENVLGRFYLRDDVFINNFKQFNLQYKSQFCLYTAHLYERGKSGEKNAIALNIFNCFFSHLEDAGLLIMAIEKWHRNNKKKPLVSYYMQEKKGTDWEKLMDFLKDLNLINGISSLALIDPSNIGSRRYWSMLKGKFQSKDQLIKMYRDDLDNAFWGIVNSLSFRKFRYFRTAFNNVKHGQRFHLNLDPLSARVFIECNVKSGIRVDMKTLDLNLDMNGLLEMLNLLVNSTKSMRVFIDWFELCNFPRNVDIDFWLSHHPKYFGKKFEPFNEFSFRDPRPRYNNADTDPGPT